MMTINKSVFKVGSLPWLIRHQLLLSIRSLQLSLFTRIILIGFVFLFFVLPSIFILIVPVFTSPEFVPEIRELISSLSIDPSYYYTASTIVPVGIFSWRYISAQPVSIHLLSIKILNCC
mgnify:CR=1 FL=1